MSVSKESLEAFQSHTQLFELPSGAECELVSFKSGLHNVSSEGDHKDIELDYEFSCKNPAQLKSLTITSFDRFNELETLYIEAVINNKALTKSLKSDDTKITF